MLSTVRTYASFVKFSHTVFALPFAIAGMVAAYAVPIRYSFNEFGLIKGGGNESIPVFVQFSWGTFALILCCMVGARSFAMAMNRILDRKIDALNPRTAKRELPAGTLSLAAALAFALFSALLYFGACFLLDPDVVLKLSPIPIGLMTVYPYAKRITALCHVVLGASLGLAPVGAWVAVRNSAVRESLGWAAVAEIAPWLLGGAVMLWVAGFDVVYALQDDEFDRANKLHSIPAALGRVWALRVSRSMHLASFLLFVAFSWAVLRPATLADGSELALRSHILGIVWAAPFVMFFGMIYQHLLVKPNDLSRVNVAFFTVNGFISVAFGTVFVLAYLLA